VPDDTTSRLPVGRELEDEVALCFLPFGEAGPLDRSGVEHRRRECAPEEVVVQNLGAVDVAAQHRGDTGRDVAAADDVAARAEDVALDRAPSTV